MNGLKRTIAASLLLFCLVLPLRAGLFFDDPIDVQAQRVSHLLGKDEIKFIPCGKCDNFMISEVEATLELQYATGKRTLHATRKMWSKTAPMVIELPDNLAGLESFRLKGTFSSIWRLKKNVRMDPKASDQENLARNMESVTGYKLDSKWTTK